MSYELFVARRYLTARRKQAFISVITFISILGITIGVAALVIAISLLTGWQEDVQDKILSATAHIMVSDLGGEGLEDYERLAVEIRRVEGVQSVSPVVYNMCLVKGSSRDSAAMLKAMDLDLESRIEPWLQRLDMGSIPTDEPREGVLLGRELAFTVGAGVGDVVEVLTPSSRLSPFGLIPKTRKLVVTGIFSTGLFEFDSSTALITLRTGQKLLSMEGKVSILQVKLDDIFRAPETSVLIKALLPPAAYVTTWMDLNKPLFSALKLEKNIMFLTITLIVFVAALNIIAGLIMMVMEKTRDIGVLIALGATSRSIMKIFFLQGAMIGFIGTTLGVLIGLGWGWLANTFELIKVPVDIYQISYVPFRIRAFDLLLIIGVSLAISLGSTLFPSHRASKTDPVMALKYE